MDPSSIETHTRGDATFVTTLLHLATGGLFTSILALHSFVVVYQEYSKGVVAWTCPILN
jgi:hypothetical protein